MVQNQSITDKVKEAYNKAAAEEQAEEVAGVIEKFINDNPLSSGCAELIFYLLQGNSYFAKERAQEFQDTIMDLLVFFTNPEIASKFSQKFHSNRDYIHHIRMLHEFFVGLSEKKPRAEMALHDIRCFSIELHQLESLRKEFQNPSQSH